jgi:hypothetical protein
MSAMVKCKRVMRSMLRLQDFVALDVATRLFPAQCIDPDQELSISSKSERQSRVVMECSPPSASCRSGRCMHRYSPAARDDVARTIKRDFRQREIGAAQALLSSQKG